VIACSRDGIARPKRTQIQTLGTIAEWRSTIRSRVCWPCRWTRALIKEVDSTEKTTRFAQEIYDAAGKLIEVHEKFPVDLGHKQL